MDLHDKRRTGDAGDSCNIAEEIETKLIVEGCVDRVAGEDQKKRIAVRLRPHHRLHADIAARARSIVDNELLAQPLRELLSNQTRYCVGRTARRVADDVAARPRRIGWRPCDPRDDRERRSARGESENFPAGKFHSALPLKIEVTVRLPGNHSGLMLAARMTFPSLSVSAATNFPRLAEDSGNGSTPVSASRVATFLSTSAALISRLSLSIISAGVSLRRPRTYQVLKS